MSCLTHHHHHHLFLFSSSSSSSSSMATTIYDQKRALRSKLRRDLKAFPQAQRAQEEIAIQNIVLDSSWFKSTFRLCAYISCEALREVDSSRILAEILKKQDADCHAQVKKKLYVPWVEDKNSHMRMLTISSMEDLVTNSMNILEPSPVDANGNQLQDENGKLPESKGTPFSTSSIRIKPLASAPSATNCFTLLDTDGLVSIHIIIFPAVFSVSNDPG